MDRYPKSTEFSDFDSIIPTSLEETLENEGWTTRKINHPNYVWLWIIVIILIIVLVVFVIFNRFWQDDQGFGTYGPPRLGQCTGASSCTEIGQQVITRTCIPNPTTGKGCLIPSGEKAGQQSYESLITAQPCMPTCVFSGWREVTTEEDICFIQPNTNMSNNISFTDYSQRRCVPQGTFGTKLRRFRCVNNDSTGVNECTNLKLREFSGPTGQMSQNLQLLTFSVGDEIEINTICQDFEDPICGDWLWSIPQLPPKKEEIPSGTELLECVFDINLAPLSDCRVESNPANVDPRWENLKEGYQVFPLSCIFQKDPDMVNQTLNGQSIGIINNVPTSEQTINKGFTPIDQAPPAKQCPILTPPTCTDQGIVPEQVRDGNIPTPPGEDFPNTLLCPGTLNNRQNPACYRPCRRYQIEFPIIGNGEFQPILGKLISLRIPQIGFLSLQQIPPIVSTPTTSFGLNPPLLADPKSDPTDMLADVPSVIINFAINKNGCSQAATEFTTTLLLSIGARDYFSGILEAQIMGLIGGSYIGWMGFPTGGVNTFSTESNNEEIIFNSQFIWQQAYNIYQGPGINSNNPKASRFQIEINSPFINQPPPGFPTGTLGTIGLSIKNSSGNSIMVPDIDGQTYNLNNVEAIVYDSETLNSDSRADRGPLNCNLLYGRGGC